MRKLHIALLSIAIFIVSCNSNPKTDKIKKDSVSVKNTEKVDSKVGLPEFSLTSITSNFSAYWIYHCYNVKLYRNFLATNENDKPIKKEDFLLKLTKGKFLPLLIHSSNDTPHYKLAKIPAGIAKEVGAVIAAYAKTQLGYFKMEGKPVPRFNFKDVNGISYSSENTKGKILMFKCWFIGCVACVKEMPELNEMVEAYKTRKDILFVSLASDDKKPLQNFLTKTTFDYAVVPNQENYMLNKLGVNIFPTHLLIDKKGNIVKIVQDADEAREVLESIL
ncbi:TlpA disulfide reductase family protein [Pedobacter aquatilis]|uniref:TlpA family protein disulfide reductase n=1 Tax=Pedobacter aquatilis TaxID=351343 RepID=UPI00292CE970|nr:TlpA disulfide reductase family protein [Pedobacter aquatilis]